MALELTGRKGDPIVGVAKVAIEAVAVVVQDSQAPVVAHAPEDQLAELGVHPAPDALYVDGAGAAPRRQHGERRERVEIDVRRRTAAQQDVVEDVRLEIDREVLAHRQRGLEAEAEVRV